MCEPGSESSIITEGWCFLSGCDKKPELVREGPSQLLFVKYDFCLRISLITKQMITQTTNLTLTKLTEVSSKVHLQN